MPASVYTEMNHNNGLVEDQRALQLAFELSMLGLNSDDEPPPSNGFSSSPFDENQRKKSANMTECVPVPSSEHVAEIVGRQGCKIKALRAKTNTYIKTPVRGEEPVFVVTGRREDVCSAKREILSAAEHFSQIRASRRNSGVSNGSNGTTFAPGPPSPTTPGQITIQVRVPYRVVGLVVGPKGATIKRIQQQTHTYIVTPSRDKEPVFEVTGLPENVEKARQEIESHIALRTGGNVDNNGDSDFLTNGIDSGFHELNGDYIGSIYKPSTHSAFSSYGNSVSSNNNVLSRRGQESSNIFSFPNVNNNTAKLNEYNALSNGFSGLNGFNIYDNDEGISSPSFDPATVWSDISDTTCNNRSSLVSLFGSTTTTTVSPRRSSSFCGNSGLGLSPPLTDNGMSSSEGSTTSSTPSVGDHPMVRRIRSDPLSNGIMNLTNGSNHQNGVYRSTSPPSDVETSPTSSNGTLPSDNGDLMNGRGRRDCIMCSDGEIVAALVPCGHNMFCMNCANDLLAKTSLNRSCPVCQQTPTQAIRILS